MKAATQHPGVAQFDGYHGKAMVFQQPDKSGLIAVYDDRIRVYAEQVHVDPLAANRLVEVGRGMPFLVFHGWTVNHIPFLQKFGDGRVIETLGIGEDQSGSERHQR